MRRLLPLLCLLTLPTLAAQPPAATPGIAVPPEIVKEFQAIEALSAKSAYAEAAQRGQALLPMLKDAPAAKALLLRNLATLYGQQQHYPHSAALLQESLDLHALPAKEVPKVLLELAQYSVAAQNYPKAEEALTALIQQDPRPDYLLMLVEIRTQLKRYGPAAATLEQLIARTPEPKAEWYEMLLGLHHESQDLDACIRDLAALIQKSPDKPLYWQQLTGIYQEAKQDKKALAVRQLMYEQGLLRTQDEIVQLAQMLRYLGLPTRAAEILQQEIDRGGLDKTPRNLGLLADNWMEARELGKAAAALEKSAALAPTGETLHRLGQIYSELRDWNKARLVLTRALAKGGLKNPGGAWLLLGMAHYRLEAKTDARAAFLQAKNT
ncbi:MAG: tetratricopeptide repeat protein, partial [Methylococcus sp.]